MFGYAQTVGLLQEQMSVAPAGRFPEGATEVPFSFVLAAKSGQVIVARKLLFVSLQLN